MPSMVYEFVASGAADERTLQWNREAYDRIRLRPSIEVIRDRNRGLGQPHQRIAVPDEHQPVRVAIRQRPQEDLIDQAEDRRIRTDPERQRQHRDERKDRLLEQRTKSVADVLHAGLDGPAV